jgi:SAM-dependent methyltransferase
MPIKFIRQRSKAAFDRLRVADLDSSIAEIETWAGQDFGRYLLHQEQQLLQRKYAQLPGYRLLHLGLAPDEQTLTGFDQLHSFYLAPGLAGASGAAAISNYAEIPLPSEVVDVAILQHAVEYSASPKAVLAEMSRVVAPGGHMLLFLYNPYGPMGLLKFPMQLATDRPQYRFHNLRKGRVVDWLSLLNFQVLEIDHGAYNLPLQRPQWMHQDSRWDQLGQKIRFPLGNFYMIHGVKREARGIAGRAQLWRPATSNGYRAPRSALSSTGSNKSSKEVSNRHSQQ